MNARALLKKVFQSAAPRTSTAVFSASARAFSHGYVKQAGLDVSNEKLLAEVGTKVLAGPFEGMELTPMTHAEHIGPFLLGSYEVELHPWWAELLRGSYAQIIDIGAKFGYYAVGLALRFPHTPVVSFDTDPWAKRATREMAQANGTSNISIQGFCSASWLRKNVRANAFLISDCEGYEAALFGDEVVPALLSATMIIELHDFLGVGTGDALAGRFAATHDIRRIASGSGFVPSAVAVRSLTEEEMRQVCTELRGEQEWMLLVPKGRPS